MLISQFEVLTLQIQTPLRPGFDLELTGFSFAITAMAPRPNVLIKTAST